MSKDREFLWRRLHSLLGVVPVGLFLVFHLSLNFTAIGGEATYASRFGKKTVAVKPMEMG